ncbi:MAG: S8 family peptidase [Flavobacteriales bacterium]
MLKIWCAALVVLCSIFPIHGQYILSRADQNELEIISNDFKDGSLESNTLNSFPINLINNRYYVSFLAKINPEFDKLSLSASHFIVGNPIRNIVSIKVPVEATESIALLQGVDFLELAGKVNHQLDKAVHDVRADSVQQGIGLPQGFRGKNVYIGVTDWGFDYTHPAFYDSTLTQTRIIAAWDQFKTSGPHPQGFNYGTEYNGTSALLAAGGDTANIYSYSTHGTHVASIAGGCGAGTNYRGVAYDANFLFVTFLVDEAAVFDAWEWMYQKAQAAGKRLVINMSWGLYHFGTLDGNSLLSQAITAYSDLGVVFVNSAGNNGNVNFHLKKTFNNDQLNSKVDFYSYAANANMWGQSIHAWGEVGHSFSNGIIVKNASNATLAESPFYHTSTTSNYVDTFLLAGTDTIFYNIAADSAHPLNQKPQMRLRVKCTNTALKILLKSTAIDGTVNYWNVTELTTDVGNWGMPFSYSGTGTTPGDADHGISEPSCSDHVISVAAYAPSYQTPGGATVGGGLASFSSHGPRYDGVMKPDVAAPGVSICSAISSYTDAAYTTVSSVTFNNKTYDYAKFSGTSMSGPVVAGACALILEANPWLSAAQVKQLIKETARIDNFTGVIPALGSPLWGMGKLNAYAAVKEALALVEVPENTVDNAWNVYPNPVVESLHFTLVDELPKECLILDAQGKCMTLPIQNEHVSVKHLKPGHYTLQLTMNGQVQSVSFIKAN